jgi:transcriptional regulator with GAF, ATPase, and Fis domain
LLILLDKRLFQTLFPNHILAILTKYLVDFNNSYLAILTSNDWSKHTTYRGGPGWLSAQEHVSRVATLERPILVIGERGTGKELIGERLHFLSKRWEGPFVKVNCAALSETLLDSELFGHERGAFTGATEQRKGRFELADGGTIFLDEIATASQQVQEKLLRVVEYGEFQRLGGSRVLTTNVRIVAATNADLPAMAEAGEFRSDLLDRLAFDVITLPPLRARKRGRNLAGRSLCPAHGHRDGRRLSGLCALCHRRHRSA